MRLFDSTLVCVVHGTNRAQFSYLSSSNLPDLNNSLSCAQQCAVLSDAVAGKRTLTVLRLQTQVRHCTSLAPFMERKAPFADHGRDCCSVSDSRTLFLLPLGYSGLLPSLVVVFLFCLVRLLNTGFFSCLCHRHQFKLIHNSISLSLGAGED